MDQVRLFSTLAVKKSLDERLLPDAERTIPIHVEPTFAPTLVLLRALDAGETFDVLIATVEAVGRLAREGRVDAGSVRPLARTGIGLARMPGSPPEADLSSVGGLVAALRAARSVAYSRTGASGIRFATLLEELGVADEVNSRATIVESGFVAETLLDGRADLAVQQLSELLFVPGTEIIGPLPAEVQHYTDFAIAAAPDAAARPGVRRFIDVLTGSRAHAAFAETLLEVPDRV